MDDILRDTGFACLSLPLFSPVRVHKEPPSPISMHNSEHVDLGKLAGVLCASLALKRFLKDSNGGLEGR